MYLPLKGVSSSESLSETRAWEERKALKRKALNGLKWHASAHAAIRYSSLYFSFQNIIDDKSCKVNQTRLTACHENCSSGGRYCRAVRINPLFNEVEIKKGYMFAGVLLGDETCKLISKYFTHLEKLVLNCGLEDKSLKSLCRGSLNQLKYLELNDCFWLSNKGVKCLSELFIRVLKIRKSDRIKKGLLKLTKSSSLRELWIFDFKQMDNKLLCKLMSGFAYQGCSFKVDGCRNVFLDSKMESCINNMLGEGLVHDVTIGGTTICG